MRNPPEEVSFLYVSLLPHTRFWNLQGKHGQLSIFFKIGFCVKSVGMRMDLPRKEQKEGYYFLPKGGLLA
ncbi:unnamed protein product [Caenorhabditis brenneri]